MGGSERRLFPPPPLLLLMFEPKLEVGLVNSYSSFMRKDRGVTLRSVLLPCFPLSLPLPLCLSVLPVFGTPFGCEKEEELVEEAAEEEEEEEEMAGVAYRSSFDFLCLLCLLSFGRGILAAVSSLVRGGEERSKGTTTVSSISDSERPREKTMCRGRCCCC